MHTFVIAEGGCCHDGSLNKALLLVQAAAESGADAVKFQYWSSSARMVERRKAPHQFDLFETYRMPRRWLDDLRGKCDQMGVEFMCTAYLPEDISVVAPYVRRFKIGSFEAGDKAFVREHRLRGKPLIISSGMETDWPLWWVGSSVLHCVSGYPTPVEQLNLGVLRSNIVNMYDGLSDHTTAIFTGAWAVCAGAQIVEKHVKLRDTYPQNPDWPHSLYCDLPYLGETDDHLKNYVDQIRLAEKALGDGVKKVEDCERPGLAHKVTG